MVSLFPAAGRPIRITFSKVSRIPALLARTSRVDFRGGDRSPAGSLVSTNARRRVRARVAGTRGLMLSSRLPPPGRTKREGGSRLEGAANAGPAVELEGVGKSYDGKVALAPLSLTLPRGRTLALVGPSGCGKSTLIRLVV